MSSIFVSVEVLILNSGVFSGASASTGLRIFVTKFGNFLNHSDYERASYDWLHWLMEVLVILYISKNARVICPVSKFSQCSE